MTDGGNTPMSGHATITQEAPSLERWGADLDKVGEVRWTREEPEPEVGARRGLSLWDVGPIALRVVVSFLVAVVVFEALIAGVMHNVRQQHLGREFLEATPRVGVGRPLAVLQIPRIELNEVVVEGDRPSELRAGPGHRIGTVRPGEAGTSIVLGHRSRFGGPFKRLGELQPGDQLAVKIRNAQSAQYFQVASKRRSPELPAAAATTVPTLLLVTAATGAIDGDYMIVEARPVGAASSAGSAPAQGGTTAARAASTGSTPSRNEGGSLVVLWGLVILGVVTLARRAKGRQDPLVVMAIGVPIAVFALYQLVQTLDAMVVFPS